jgi:outer membrane lipoprotein LolB
VKSCRHLVVWLLSFAILFIAGCASIQRDTGRKAPEIDRWHGRLAVRVQADPAAGLPQGQSFSAQFELHGNPQQGDLTFYTPLGSTAAAIHWLPGRAELQARGETREFGDLNQLISNMVGTDIPVDALFLWLDGRAQDADGWQVDLSEKSQGKILARRLSPAPPAELRVLLDD